MLVIELDILRRMVHVIRSRNFKFLNHVSAVLQIVLNDDKAVRIRDFFPGSFFQGRQRRDSESRAFNGMPGHAIFFEDFDTGLGLVGIRVLNNTVCRVRITTDTVGTGAGRNNDSPAARKSCISPITTLSRIRVINAMITLRSMCFG